MNADARALEHVRRCSGCHLPLRTDRDNTFKVIEPSGRLRVFCDSDCLRFFYLDDWRAFLRGEGLRADGCLCDLAGEADRRRRGGAAPDGP